MAHGIDEMDMAEEDEIVEDDMLEGAEEPTIASSTITATLEEMPELEGMGPGEVVMMEIVSASDDGTSFDLQVVADEAAAGGEPAPGAEPGLAAEPGLGAPELDQAMMAG